MFGLRLYYDDFENEPQVQKRKTSYVMIREWIRRKYGVCATNLQIQALNYYESVVNNDISRVRNCLRITCASNLSKHPYAASESLAVARYGYVFLFAYERLSCVICTSYFWTVPNRNEASEVC